MQAYARTAPISVVRDMRHIIIGTVPGAAPDEPVLDCVSLGLVTQSLSNTLLEGARTIPFQRYGLTSTLEEACPESPLLFATCLLLGIYVIPNLCNSRLHVALYTHVEDMVTKALLRTPLSIETVQAFLLISLWHTVPLEKERYIDSWLMSGMAIMHGTLSIDLSKDSEEETENRRMLRRTWNALCLAHLQFSVGTGRPPIIGTSNMGAFLTDLECPDVGDTDDQIIVAQSQLYSMLYDLITCQAPSLNMICDKIEGWKSKYEVLLEADDSYSLAFSYSCAYLILYRHSLKILTDPASPFYPLDVPGDDIETRMQALVNLALDHSSKIMNLYAKIAALYGNVPPVFAYLMCVNAAITVVEFKQDLKNPGEIFKLMERLHLSFHDPGNDPVFEWAVNVMKKACAESRGDSA
ncbi:hypothetical protein BX600DRAFT_461195 [Xylariales sp. PMI_506]|nr:hypothetical protein BX600DRAFT_461195 [Xylariales sp. PMI_506]